MAMYSVLDPDLPTPRNTSAAVAGELGSILQMRQAVMESRELLYCSPMIQALVADEIPRLISLATRRR